MRHIVAPQYRENCARHTLLAVNENRAHHLRNLAF